MSVLEKVVEINIKNISFIVDDNSVIKLLNILVGLLYFIVMRFIVLMNLLMFVKE